MRPLRGRLNPNPHAFRLRHPAPCAQNGFVYQDVFVLRFGKSERHDAVSARSVFAFQPRIRPTRKRPRHGQGFQQRAVGGQHRRHCEIARLLPRPRLPFPGLQFARPPAGFDPHKPQVHARVFVRMDFGQPRYGAADADTEFFFKLALQRLKFGFARLDLAAGKFPIPRVRFSFGARTEQVVAVFIQDDAGDDADEGAGVWFCHGCQSGRNAPAFVRIGKTGRLKRRRCFQTASRSATAKAETVSSSSLMLKCTRAIPCSFSHCASGAA